MIFDSPITSTPAPAPPRRRNGGTKARQSLRKTLTIEAGNDDDAERSNLAGSEPREAAGATVATPTHSNSSESNQSMSLTPQKEHYEGCLKLFAENKITRENAWNLRLIDYMTTMLRRRDARMEDLQTASVLVEASARIYGARVDSLHHDVLVMAGGLNKAVHSKRGKKGDDNGEEEGLAPDEAGGGGAAPHKKKKRRLKGAIAANPDGLAGELDTNLCIDPFFEMLCATSGDVTSSSRAFHGTLRVHDRTMALILRTDAPFLEQEEESGAGPVGSVVVRRALTGGVGGAPLCEPFARFDLCRWDPDTEESEYRRCEGGEGEGEGEALDLSHQAVAFDVDALVEPIPDTHDHCDEEDGAGGAESGVEEEGVELCARVGRAPVARLADMRPGGAADSRLEYSYCGVITAAWAGPAHWRLKHNRASHSLPSRRPGGASAAGAAGGAGAVRAVRRQPQFVPAGLAWDWRASPPHYEPAPPHKIMISRKTLATAATWNEDNYKTPVDRGLDESFFRTLFSRGRVVVPRRRRGPGPAPDPEPGPPVEPARDYDYDNENDASYCPLHVQEGDTWGPADGTAEPPPRAQLLPADEPIEPPPKIPKVFIPYALRAKKVDMKQLKVCTWKTLVEGGEVAPTTFLSVYGRVRRRLGAGARDAMSLPLALLALLHLANERGLQLHQRPDLSDIDVGPLSLPVTHST